MITTTVTATATIQAAGTETMGEGLSMIPTREEWEV